MSPTPAFFHTIPILIIIQITPTGCIRLLQYVEKKKRLEAKVLVTESERARRSALGVEKLEKSPDDIFV